MDIKYAEAAVRRDEAKRLERLKAADAAPMETDSIEGHSGGGSEQPRDEAADPKRARIAESSRGGLSAEGGRAEGGDFSSPFSGVAEAPQGSCPGCA